jgi:uncharacterized protein (TIGR03067 family)
MFTRAFLPFGLVFLIAPSQPTEKADKELAKLQGEWTVVSADYPGEKSSAAFLKDISPLVIKDNKWSLHKGFSYTIRIEPTTNPKQLDLIRVLKKGNEVWRGIYKLDGDTLTFCKAVSPVGEWPREFKAGDKVVLFVFKRAGK